MRSPVCRGRRLPAASGPIATPFGVGPKAGSGPTIGSRIRDKTRIARTELIKTQTLAAELAHKEVISGILQDIVRIRLAGQEDRARLTNEHLARMETSSEEFDVETSEVEARIQQYLDFNAALLTQIEEYQSTLRTRLETLKESIAEQQANIDALEEEARNIAIPEDSE